jgi:predicted enzyme related to lactoylglutathione lyase
MDKPNGLFGWVDLMTTDTEAATAFYAGLFGWSAEAMPVGPEYTYYQFRKDGAVVAGMGGPPPGAPADTPSVWSSYVLVDDIEATVAATVAHGGSLVMPVMDIMTQGRQAVIADPSGAVVGLWQSGDHAGAEAFNVPGALTWNELQTRDLAAASAFYAAVFGWRWVPMEDSDYLVGHLDAKTGEDTSNCGAMPMPEMVPPEAPSMWMVYFAVADCDESVARAQALGGGVFLPAMQMGPGRFAGISDPGGAMFFLGSFPTT